MPHTKTTAFVLPYEPQYTAHRKNERARVFTALMQHLHENRLHEFRASVSPLLFANGFLKTPTTH
jgi:hypothetical protein